MSSIKCGNCKQTHGTVTEVKACYTTTNTLPREAVGVLITPKFDDTYWDAEIQRADRDETERVARFKALRDEQTMQPTTDRIGVRKENMFGGKCIKCGGWVEATEGILSEARNRDGRFDLEHKNCPAKAAPAPSKAPAAGVNEDGMYRTPDGTIFKVQFAVHGSGGLYAKQLAVISEAVRGTDGKIVTAAKVKFTYALGAVRSLTPAMKMTLEEAKAFGALYGTCCVCGRTLTKEESIDAGIGPVCSGKAMWTA